MTQSRTGRPVDGLLIHSARRQHAGAADKIAARILNLARAVREDLAHGRPATAAARELDTQVTALLETLAELRTVEKFAAWARDAAA